MKTGKDDACRSALGEASDAAGAAAATRHGDAHDRRWHGHGCGVGDGGGCVAQGPEEDATVATWDNMREIHRLALAPSTPGHRPTLRLLPPPLTSSTPRRQEAHDYDCP